MADASHTAELLDARVLRACGRDVPGCFQLALPTAMRGIVSGPLQCEQILRCLPGRRLVFLARASDGRQMVAKVHLYRAARAMRAERVGLTCLRDAGLAAPALLAEAPLEFDAGIQLTEFIAHAQTLAARWPAATAAQRGQYFATLAAGFARMHAAGARHMDPHLGNFLLAQQVHAIDGGAVRTGVRALPPAQRLRALAQLHGQCAPQDDLLVDTTLASYRAAGGSMLQRSALLAEIDRVRAKHVRAVLRKTLRDCSEFHVQRTPRVLVVCRRDALASMQGLLADPDKSIAAGVLLKAGNTATVARVAELSAGSRIVKRYNIKGVWHGLTRLFRYSRAERTWLAAHRLALLGIRTARPIAMRLETIGPLRGRAYLWMEDVPGATLAQRLQTGPSTGPGPGSGIDACLRERVAQVIVRLHDAGLLHGDLKASNILVGTSEVVLVDLDALVALPAGARRDQRQVRERERFLENFVSGVERDAWREALQHARARAQSHSVERAG